MVLPNGRALGDPSNAEIAEAAAAPRDFDEHAFDVVIVGSGPAGLSAAVYGASEGLRVLVVDEGGIGGQARSSSLIRNYLGFARGVSGNRLAEQAYEQASVFGAGFVLMHRASALRRAGDRLEVLLSDGRRASAATVILATGATYRRLAVPSLEALNGSGVFYGAPTSEAHALHGKDAYIVGGGNSAGQAALDFARYAHRVTLVVRAASLDTGMSHYLVREVEASPKVDVRAGTVVAGGGGDGRLQELVLRDGSTGDETTVGADALFVMIGARPHTDWLPHEIARDAGGFLFTGGDVLDDQRRAARAPAVRARDKHAGGACGRRRTACLGQAGRLGGGGGLDRSAVRPQAPRGRATAQSGNRMSYAAVGGPNQVVSASASPSWVGLPPRPHIRRAESARRWER